MRKILSILLTISIIFSCINFSVFAETEGALSISAPTSASPGETINVILNIPNNTNALNGSFNLVYDNTALSVVTCTSGTILNDRNVVINKTYAENKIRMSFDGDTPLTQGGILLNVSFNVLSGASGTISFDVEKFKLLDENYNTIDISETTSTQMYIVNDAETKISVNCNDTVNTGEEITVTVDISNSLNICGGGFNLVYDADKFSVSSATAGSILSSFTKQLNKTYASNKVRLTWAGYSNMTQDGTILTVVFKTKDGVNGEAVFSIEKFSFGDLNGATYDGVTTSATTNVVCTHNVMNWVVTEEASCSDKGTESYMCGCGHITDTREIAATGHIEMEWVITKEATCDNTGAKEYTCKACGYVEKTEEIAAHGHIYESVVTAPTQAEGGFTTHTCTGCGYSYTDSPTAATGYTISYDVSGGTGAPASQTKYHDETITLSLDIPTREGYVFLGWTRIKDGNVAEFAPGSSYRDNADATLYAVWSANKHTITYVVDGETYSVQSYDYGTVIEAISEPEKEGYTFSGWNEIPVTMPDNDITITGSFIINTYNVIFDTNDNDIIFDEQVVEYGSMAIVPNDTPVLDGYSFVGWALSKNAKKAEYKSGDTFEVKENITLYAVWNVIWDGNEGEGFAGGKGTITSPYRIENAAHLSYMAKMINSGEEGYASAYYIMTNNISLNDISNVENWATKAPENEWTPIGIAEHKFSGIFDGNGYEIKGIYINKTGETDADSNQGLFGFVDGATISNFTIGDSYVRGYHNVGTFIGNANNVTIKNCINEGMLNGIRCAGGIVGIISNSTINDCYNYGLLNGDAYIGGVSGKGISSTFKQCYNLGTIGNEKASSGIAGICGYSDGTTIIACGNLAQISGSYSDVAGIVGCMSNSSVIDCCYNIGTIKGNRAIGGIVGYIREDNEVVKSCINYGNISQLGNEANTGGICGYLNSGSTLSKCINVGTITDSGSYKGAIAGKCNGTVEDCIYLSTCGAAGSGKALSYIELQRPVNYTGFYSGYVGSDYYFIGTNPYTAYPEIHNMRYPAARPITLNTNGGYLPEYIYAAKTYASELNGSRGAHELVIYDDSKETTGTNIYGNEAIVNSRNEVIGYSGYGENNSAIPTGGFVISGHGFMHYWLKDNVEVGDKIYYDSSTLEIRVYKKDWNYTYFPGNVTYLPTPHKDGYVFSGWQDESGRIITYSTEINDINSLNLTATWTKPEIADETTYGNSKYMRFDVGTCYESAKRYCESIGGHLATITSAEENAAIIDMTYDGAMSGYIIGASDSVVEGTFAWDTGEVFSYSNWNSGEPNDSIGIEDAIEIKKVWNDISDSNHFNRGFVCEIDNYKPIGATTYNGHYYQIFNNNVSWEYAKAYCESKGGHLATVTSQEENDALIDALEKYYSSGVYYWLGASDVSAEGDWEWVTGEDFSYTNWNSAQPDNAHSTEHYLHVYTDDRFGKWNDLPNIYSSKMGFICEFDSISPIATTEYNGHRYEIYTNPLAWAGAKDACEFAGGHLVTLNSQEEYDFVTSFYQNSLDISAYPGYYVGGNKIDNTWQWITGEIWEVPDTFWGEDEPDNYYGNEYWLEYWVKVNGLNDIRPIYYQTTAFICEFEPEEENDNKSGIYENVNWSLVNGILKILGEGVIIDSTSYPWDEYIEEITSIVIEDGITDVRYAFSKLTNIIENISIPKSITNFPENFGYGKITNVTYAGSKYDFEKLISQESTDFADATMTYGEYSIVYNDLLVQNVAIGESLTITSDIPEKENMIFVGWATQETATTAEYVSGDKITPESDTILYPLWKESVTIKYDANGGINAPETQSVAANEKIKISEQIPTLSGHIFLGWSDDIFSDSVKYFQGCEYVFSENITLYAVWKEGIEGSLDESVLWKIDNGILSINGTGKLSNFAQGNAPWNEYKNQITNVVIGDNITSIGDYAFYGLDKVTSVEMGGVTSIGDYAFSNCSSLSSIDISKVTEFGSYAFRYCGALTEVIIVSDDVKYGNNVFSNCTGVNSVSVNDGITKIPSGLLGNCGTIANISIPDSVMSIAENAFVDTLFTNVIFEGTKDDFADLLTTKNTLLFDKVKCVVDAKIYTYADFFAEIINITNISLEKKSLGLYIGESAVLTPEITPSNTTEGYSWRSDNEAVVKVDNSGNVTALSEGIANITVTSESGAVKASCVVYVNSIADENAPAITVGSVEEIKNGDSFDVNISIKNNPGIASMRLNLVYDNSVMELTNVTDLGIIGGSLHSEDYTSNNYVLYWDNGTSKTNFTESGDVVTLTFKVKDNIKSGDYPLVISYDTQDIINCELVPVSFDIVNGYVTVKAFTYGDVNDDESVDTIDSAYLSRYIARWTGVSVNSYAADVNKDKKVNVLDSAILKRHIANWTDYRTLPYSEPISLLSSTTLKETVKPTIVVSDVKGQCGKTVDITISIKDNPGIVSMRLDVEYDKDAMTLTKVTDTGLLPGEVHGNDLLDMPYCLYWDNGSSNTDYTVNGHLVTLTFLLKENITGDNYPITISYNYDEPDIINALLKPVSIDIVNGQISVIEVTEPQIVLSNVVIGEKTNYKLQLLSPDTISGVVFIATYDKNTSQLRTLAKYDAITQKDFSIDTKNGETVKIMWWDGINSIRPIADSVIVNEE